MLRSRRAAAENASNKIASNINDENNTNAVNSPPVQKRKRHATRGSNKSSRTSEATETKKKGRGKKNDDDYTLDEGDADEGDDDSADKGGKKCHWKGWICYKVTGGGRVLTEEEVTKQNAVLDAWMKGGK